MTGLSHKDDLLETPPWLFNQIEKETGLKFKTDMCATGENKKCRYFLSEFYNALDPLLGYKFVNFPMFCNPPRSKNGKFVKKVNDIWEELNEDIVMLLCWNDLGNKYGEKLLPSIKNEEIQVKNLGKIKFYKNGKETEFVSRLTYFYAWFKKKH